MMKADKKKLFIQEYLIDLNATQAAIRAGFSAKTARQQGARLLSKVNIQKAIQKAMKKREEKTGITAARVLNEIAIIAFSDIQNYIEINNDTGAIRAKGFEEMPEGASRALESIKEDRMIREDAKGKDSIINEKVTFKMYNKLGALEDLAEHLGILKKNINIKHSGEIKTNDPLIVKVIFVKDDDGGNGDGDKKP